METRSIYDNLSALDHRYSVSDPALFKELSHFFAESAAVRYCVQVEKALVLAHLHFQGINDPAAAAALEGIEDRVNPEEVYAEEAKTRHNIRALVNVMMRHVPESIRHLVHMGTTSVDILDTAQALRVRDGVRGLILPMLCKLEGELCRWAEQEADTPQVGRTHGQFAVPITLGYTFAEYVSRLGKSIKEIDRLSRGLAGKIAGAVGAYNATSLIYADPEAFEAHTLGLLGLQPSEHSTQMVEPEYVLRLLIEINVAFGVIANLADDLRHLQRSEIDEVREYFAADQVGSSTMPQKRNPWNAEHVKSLWKAFFPRVNTFFMDQISEHQRDLSNSASSRFVMDYLSGFTLAVARMVKILEGMSARPEGLAGNLAKGGAGVLAEAAYILLSRQGESEGHEIIRKLTLKAEGEKRSFIDVLREDQEVWARLETGLASIGGLPPGQFFADPGNYRGKASDKARALAVKWRQEMAGLESGLTKKS
jgi:adenylosuccinate lyase